MAGEQVDLDGAVWLRRDAVADGYDDRQIAQRVRSGEWHRIRRGAYVSGALWETLSPEDRHRVRARAVLRTAHPSAALSHLSAAVEWGAQTFDVDLECVHITRTDGKAGRRDAGVLPHRGLLEESEVLVHNGVRVTSAARSVAESCTILDVEASVTIANGLLHQRLFTVDDFQAQADHTRYWPNSLTTELVLRLADPRIESVAESRAWCVFWRQRVPRPVPQVEVFDDRGRLVGRVDFAWPEQGVFAEIDGKVKYVALRRPGESLDDFLLREKRREEMICQLTGWVCVRITWEDLARPRLLASRINKVLRSRRVYSA